MSKPAEVVWQVPKLALTVQEACEALGVCWHTWSEHVAPHVRVVRIGKRKLVPVRELERWLAKESERQRVPG